MNNPLISIIIPVFNSSSHLFETLQSIEKQLYSNWECIVVDDGSSDNSIDILVSFVEKDKRFKLFRRPVALKKGANSCRNFGFEQSIGEFVNWFDSDDIMLENFLSEKVKSINENLNLIITSGYSSSFDLKSCKPIDLFLSNNIYKQFALGKLRILTPSVLFRRSYLENKLLFLDWIKRGQESEFFLRLFYQVDVSNFIILNKHLFLYRSHNDSISSKNKNYNVDFKESELYIVKQNFERANKLNDKELLKSSFRLLLNLLKLAIVNCDNKNNEDTYLYLNTNLVEKNRFFILILKLIIITSKHIDISFLKWDKFLKKYPINF
ncbi:glycosyltransferase family 2 protein [Lutibacter sp.]|uniref:glycosyltransferase family 2 protein n=1 Tax=Lutibacter sp. TaxID=1925666 RepID=UPI0035646C15